MAMIRLSSNLGASVWLWLDTKFWDELIEYVEAPVLDRVRQLLRRRAGR